MLVLTDHSNHSVQNSLYALVHAMRSHPACAQLDVATRGGGLNDFFFDRKRSESLFVNRVDEHFAFHANGRSFRKNLRREQLQQYDVIWLRMPPPLSDDFLDFLRNAFPGKLIINRPEGIQKTGDKRFLLEFPGLCPPMKACTSVEDILEFKNRFPIVLKPFREYGGRGIVKIDGDQVWEGEKKSSLQEFITRIQNTDIGYLGVRYLKNVGQGDKRIIVVDGHIMGASLRLPPQGSWICNVAQGGQARPSEADTDERVMIAELHPVLEEMGIVMYGVDTLVGEDGKRVLSELNTTSIGGLPQMAKFSGIPLLQQAAGLMWNYITLKIQTKNDPANRQLHSSS